MDEVYLCNAADVHPTRNAFLFQILTQLPWIIKAERSLNIFCAFLHSILRVCPTVTDEDLWCDQIWLKTNKSQAFADRCGYLIMSYHGVEPKAALPVLQTTLR